MEIKKILIQTDIFLDYIPVVSTFTNFIDLFQKCAWIPLQSTETIKNNRYYTHLNNKSFIRCVVLCVPLLGNIIIGWHDLFKKGEKRPTESLKLILPKTIPVSTINTVTPSSLVENTVTPSSLVEAYPVTQRKERKHRIDTPPPLTPITSPTKFRQLNETFPLGNPIGFSTPNSSSTTIQVSPWKVLPLPLFQPEIPRQKIVYPNIFEIADNIWGLNCPSTDRIKENELNDIGATFNFEDLSSVQNDDSSIKKRLKKLIDAAATKTLCIYCPQDNGKTILFSALLLVEKKSRTWKEALEDIFNTYKAKELSQDHIKTISLMNSEQFVTLRRLSGDPIPKEKYG